MNRIEWLQNRFTVGLLSWAWGSIGWSSAIRPWRPRKMNSYARDSIFFTSDCKIQWHNLDCEWLKCHRHGFLRLGAFWTAECGPIKHTESFIFGRQQTHAHKLQQSQSFGNSHELWLTDIIEYKPYLDPGPKTGLSLHKTLTTDWSGMNHVLEFLSRKLEWTRTVAYGLRPTRIPHVHSQACERCNSTSLHIGASQIWASSFGPPNQQLSKHSNHVQVMPRKVRILNETFMGADLIS